jgi:hypothetical protein
MPESNSRLYKSSSMSHFSHSSAMLFCSFPEMNESRTVLRPLFLLRPFFLWLPRLSFTHPYSGLYPPHCFSPSPTMLCWSISRNSWCMPHGSWVFQTSKLCPAVLKVDEIERMIWQSRNDHGKCGPLWKFGMQMCRRSNSRLYKPFVPSKVCRPSSAHLLICPKVPTFRLMGPEIRRQTHHVLFSDNLIPPLRCSCCLQSITLSER